MARLYCAPDDMLRLRSGLKWSRVGRGELPADIAELDFAVASPIRSALLRAVRLSDFGYPDFAEGSPVTLKKVFSARTRRLYGWTPRTELTELSAQVTQALCCVVLAFTRPGDRVLVHTPAYPPFLAAIRDLGRRPVTLPVADVENVDELIGGFSPKSGRIRLVVLCQPHNPTGHIFNAATLAAFAELTIAHDALVFSDEIYQDLAFSPHRHRPAALTPGLEERTITFTSAAKSFNIPGLRCAIGHFGSPRLHDGYVRLPWHLRDGAGIAGIAATLAAWEHAGPWLEELRRVVRRNRDLIAARLPGLHGAKWTAPAAGFLAWIDFRDTLATEDPRNILRRRAGVVLQPGEVYGPEFSSFARLNFGTSRERLERLLDRIETALAGNAQPDVSVT